MRIVVLSALLVSSVSLAACGGGGMDSISNGGVLSAASAGCLPSIDTSMNVGSINAPATDCPAPPPPPTIPTTPNGQPLPPVSTVNTGNTTQIAADQGDVTLAVEKGVLIHSKTVPAQSRLTLTNGTTSATKTAKIQIDTKTDRNGTWPKPKTQTWYQFGTQRQYSQDLASNGDVVAAPLEPLDPLNPTKLRGAQALGGIYHEYRSLSTDAGQPFDESLQVWTWGNSYASQYRDTTTSSKPAGHQAWSFGGTKTDRSAMPTQASGQVLTFTGKFASTAITANFVEDRTGRPFSTMANNNSWSVTGDAFVGIDFSNDSMTGRLDPKFWQTDQVGLADPVYTGPPPASVKVTGWATVDVDQALSFTPLATRIPTNDLDWQRIINNQNYNAEFMSTPIFLNGQLNTPILPPGAAAGATPPGGNLISGTASFGDASPWVTNNTANPMYASMFGATGSEVTGVFALDAVLPAPFGGSTPIEDDRRATISHVGVFHAE